MSLHETRRDGTPAPSPLLSPAPPLVRHLLIMRPSAGSFLHVYLDVAQCNVFTTNNSSTTCISSVWHTPRRKVVLSTKYVRNHVPSSGSSKPLLARFYDRFPNIYNPLCTIAPHRQYECNVRVVRCTSSLSMAPSKVWCCCGVAHTPTFNPLTLFRLWHVRFEKVEVVSTPAVWGCGGGDGGYFLHTVAVVAAVVVIITSSTLASFTAPARTMTAMGALLFAGYISRSNPHTECELACCQ